MESRIGVVAFAFGTPRDIRSNRIIGKFATREARERGALVFTQLDVPIGLDVSLDITYAKEERGSPPPTLRIAREVAKWMIRRDIDELIVVCAKPHMWRCKRDLSRVFKDEILVRPIRFCEEIKTSQNNVWFCYESTQKRTQTWWRWHWREIILKLLPFRIYSCIAS